MKRRYLFIALALIMMLTACSKEPEGNEYVEMDKSNLSVAPKEGGEIIVPIKNIETMNPLHTSNNYYYNFSKLIFDELFQYDDEGKVTPNLVEYYNLSPDGLILSVTLKEDVKWHDGAELTTEDVKMSFDALKYLEPSNPNYKYLESCVGNGFEFDINEFAKAKIFDKRNIDFIFDKPYVNHLEMLVFPVFPSHLYSAAALPTDDKFLPIGTGPYKFEEKEANQFIKLVKNPEYHSKQPFVETIIGKFIDDSEQAIISFETGQLNVTKDNGSFGWSKFESNTRIKFEEFNTTELEIVALNTSKSKFQGEVGRAVRKAITEGINKPRILNRVYLDKGVETSFLIKPNPRPQSDSQKTETYGERLYYSDERAKETLTDVGFIDINNDGLLEDELGNTIDIGVKTNSLNKNRLLTAEFIVEDLRAIGINAYLDFEILNVAKISKTEEENEFISFKNQIQSGDYDLAIYGINVSEVVDLTSMLHSNSIGNGMNIARYSDPEMDLLLEKTKVRSDDEKTLQELYEEVGALFYRDLPYIPLLFKMDAILIDTKIQNDINPINSNWYRGFRNVFILKHEQK